MAENEAPLIYREEKEIAFIEINRPERRMPSVSSAGNHLTAILMTYNPVKGFGR